MRLLRVNATQTLECRLATRPSRVGQTQFCGSPSTNVGVKPNLLRDTSRRIQKSPLSLFSMATTLHARGHSGVTLFEAETKAQRALLLRMPCIALEVRETVTLARPSFSPA